MQFSIYRSELPALGETHITVAWIDAQPKDYWGSLVDHVEAPTARAAIQIYLDRVGLCMPWGGLQSAGNAGFIILKQPGKEKGEG
jgi:hypothetical protein